MPLTFNRTHAASAVGILLAVGSGLLLHEFRLGSGLTTSSYDLLHVWRGDVHADEAVMIYLDEKSHLELGQPLNAPWDRSLHARLVERLTAAGARAIVFDIVFSEANSNNPAADERLAKAIKQSGRVILGADYIPIEGKANQAIPPFDLVRDSAVEIGSVELAPDADSVVRQHTPRLDKPLSSLRSVATSFP